MRNLLSLALTALVLLVSCAKEEGGVPSGESLDAQLTDRLDQITNGVGKSNFILPFHEDYSAHPSDPRNPITKEKVELGQLLFHETALATSPKYSLSEGEYSCGTCHNADAGFKAAVPQGIAEGGLGFGLEGRGRAKRGDYPVELIDVQERRPPSTLNAGYQKNVFWNGMFGSGELNEGTEHRWDQVHLAEHNYLGYEGVETQTIMGLKLHGLRNTKGIIQKYPEYKARYDAAFPELTEEERYTEISTALAMAAFVRTITTTQAPWQEWLRGDDQAMSEDQKLGAMIFFGKAGCSSCHTGPALNSMSFHAFGFDDLKGERVHRYHPDHEGHLGRYEFTGKDQDKHKFKTPHLYNLVGNNFYGHGSSMNSVREVVEYKNRAVPQKDVPAEYLSSQFVPLGLSDKEVDQLTIFLEEALFDPDVQRYFPHSTPSGNCMPNNDPQSRVDIGCN